MGMACLVFWYCGYCLALRKGRQSGSLRCIYSLESVRICRATLWKTCDETSYIKQTTAASKIFIRCRSICRTRKVCSQLCSTLPQAGHIPHPCKGACEACTVSRFCHASKKKKQSPYCTHSSRRDEPPCDPPLKSFKRRRPAQRNIAGAVEWPGGNLPLVTWGMDTFATDPWLCKAKPI